MSEKFECPKCGAVNEQCYDDILDQEDYGSVLSKKYYGHCGACKTVLVWWEDYRFEGYTDIETRED